MQKTKLGISVGALGALIFFSTFFSGYLIAIILTGYVLLFEENAWLKRSAVKAVVLMVFFSIVVALLNIIPDVISAIENFLYIFNAEFSIIVVDKIVNFLCNGLDIIEKILFLGLGFKALNQGTIVIPFIETKINKYFG